MDATLRGRTENEIQVCLIPQPMYFAPYSAVLYEQDKQTGEFLVSEKFCF